MGALSVDPTGTAAQAMDAIVPGRRPMQPVQFPVFCMEKGPPPWFYCFTDQDQLTLHLSEFADMPCEFMYWDKNGSLLRIDDHLESEASASAPEFLFLVTRWLTERGAWRGQAAPALDRLPNLIDEVA
jgi:hypothetical protein